MTSSVRSEYAALAARYDRRWAAYNAGSMALLRPFVAGAEPGDVLDLACGTANLAPRLAEWGARAGRYVGADLAPEMLLAARPKLAAVPFPAALATADAAALPFRDAAFGTVVSASALHDWAEPEVVLAEVHRVLRGGGRFILLDWCRDALRMKALDLALRISRNPFHRMYSSEEAAGLLRGAGFRVVRQNRAAIGFPWELMVFDAVAE
ncbi:class I SAM-dependent methyltransferase [Longimicrobium sp.]|uniref:class I SAM-dependent methyltransferase n=1 Tax=Longimicrobium sp. TaxID=2029185 RepID=UPI002C4B960B|nr:class I SAM-dependent methyltransferase [Longimicrobium sp.]HSU14495.1 class I SAM-dependent methyltransferase [Longimicrobium sp.]